MADKSKAKLEVQVGFAVNKQGLSEIQEAFNRIISQAESPNIKLNAGLQQAAKTSQALSNILSKTFNSDLGTLNVTKFNQELSKSNLTLNDVQKHLSNAGELGINAYNRLSQSVLGTNQQLAQSSKLLDGIATTFKNVVKYNLSSAILNNVVGSIEKAYSYTKNLDKSLNDIRIVTSQSAESMNKFAESANEAAKNLGANTLDYTNAALIYYQQGLSDAEVQARAETTIKAANVTGQTGAQVSEQLTAVWNGYKVTAEETETYVDKLAAVAATTAADLEELSVGMSKVASAANAMGVDFDDLNAQIATIVSVTRQAPESVGTALKTIYARLGDLSVEGGVDEFGVSLGKVSEQMQMMGIQILDQQGELRNMSDVIAEVAAKWDTWTEAQRQAAAVAMAGKRQYNNLIALFDNWDMYTKALNTSQEALGTLQQQQDVYMESTSAKLKTLQATWQDLYGDLIKTDEINAGIEALTSLVDLFDKFIESFGGGIKSVAAFGTIVSSVFNKQISQGISNSIQRIQVFKNNLELAKTINDTRQKGALKGGDTAKSQAIEANTKAQIDYSQKIYEARLGLNQEQTETLIGYQKEIGALKEVEVEEKLRVANAEKQYVKEEDILSILDGNYNKLQEIIRLNAEATDQKRDEYDSANEVYNKYKEVQEVLVGCEEEVGKIVGQHKAWNTKVLPDTLNAIKNFDKLSQSEKDNLTNIVNQINNQSISIAQKKKLIKKAIDDIVDAEDKHSNKLAEEEKRLEEEVNSIQRIEESYYNINQTKERRNNFEQEADSLLDIANNASKVTTAVTTVTSSLGNLAMAWSSVNSLMDTWTDDSISIGDKLTQTLMTLGMSIPIVISNFSKLSEVIGITTIAVNAETTAEELNIAIKDLNKTKEWLRAEQEIAKTMTGLTDITVQNTIVEEAQKAVEEQEAIVQELNNKQKEEAILLSKGHYLAKLKEIIAIKNGTSALTEETQKQLMANAAKMKSIAIIGAIVVALSAAVKAYNNHLENLRKVNEKTLEEVKDKEESIKANQELYESYTKLYGQLKKGENVQDSLYDTTLKLADAYDIQGAKILALSGRYDILTNKIEEARKKELDLQVSEAQKGARSAGEKAVLNQGSIFNTQSMGVLVGNNYMIGESLSSKGTSQGRIQQEALKAAGLEKNYNNLTGIFSKNVDYTNPEAVKEWMDQVDKMVEYYQNNVDEITRNSDSFYQILIKEQQGLAENGQELIAQLSLKYSGMIEKAILDNEKIKLNEQTTASELLALKEELKNSLGIPEEEFEEGFKNYLKNIDSIEDAYTKLEIAEQINEKINEGAEEGLQGILEQIQNFNNAELAFLEAHLNTAILDQDLEEWKEKNKDVLDALGAQETASSFKDVLSNYNEKDGVTPEQQTTIYNNEGMSSYMPSESSFGQMDEGDKLNAITQAWIESTKAAVEYKDEAIKALKDQQKEVKNQLQLEQQSALMNEQIIDKKIKGNEKLEGKLYNIIEVLKKLSSEGYGELNDEEKQLLKNVKDENILTEKQIKEYGETAKKVDDLSDAYEDYEDEIKRINNLSEDHATNVNALKQVMQKQSGIMDDIQSAYKSLIGVVDDYNESGSFTIDTVQQLMSMDDAYVATLQFENGQLSLNEQAFQALTIAKIDDMEQTAVLTAQEELEKLAEEGVADASMSATSTILNAAAAARDASEAAKEGAAAWDEYAASMRAAAGVSGTQYDAKAKQITDALQNRLLAAENAKSQIRKGGTSMRKAMGGGSGSKDKGKDREDKELKNLDEEFDRYWELKKAIDATDKAIQKLEKDQANLHGYQLIDSLKKENELLETQKGNYEALLAAQQERAAALRAELGTMGVMFDASGAITNYAEATANALATYNKAIQKYNAGGDEAAFEAAEKSFENFKKLLEEYDKLYYTEIQETQDKIDEAIRKQKENNLKAWEEEIKVKLDWQDLKRGWKDFLKMMKEDFKSIFPDLRVESKNNLKKARTYTKKGGTIDTDIQAVNDVKAEIDKMMAGGQSDMFESVSQAQEKLKELNEQLQNDTTALHDLIKETWQNYLDGIDQVEDKLDAVRDRYEDITSEIEFQAKLIKLIYGDTKQSYSLMSKYYEGMIQSNSNKIETEKSNVELWSNQFAKSGADINRPDKWTEDQKKLYDNWMAAQEKLNDLTLKQIELLQDNYKNTVENILYDMNKALAEAQDQWERISKFADKYYDSVEGSYHIQSLANKYNSSIADETSIKNQQKLNELKQKELDMLTEKKNTTEGLTEYDIKAANLRYELALKEIALEESQNNKTSMKLTRNEQGNWAYQYVADDEDVANKRQELLDTYNELYQLASDAYEKNLEAMLDLKENYLAKAKEIAESEALTETEKNTKLKELYQNYLNDYRILADENALYRDDLEKASAGLLLQIYKDDETAYERMTDEEKGLVDALTENNISDYSEVQEAVETNLDNIKDKSESVMSSTRQDWKSTAQEFIDEWNKDKGGSVTKTVVEGYDAIVKANGEYSKAITKLEKQVGRDFSETGITGAIDRAKTSTDNLYSATKNLADDGSDYIDKLRSYVEKLEEAWDGVKEAIEDTIDLIEEYLQKRAEAASAEGQSGTAGTSSGSTDTATGNAGENGTKTGSTSNTANNTGWKHAFAKETYTGTNGYNYNLYDENGKLVFQGHYNPLSGKTKADVQKEMAAWAAANHYIIKYKSGGYTGSWGEEGRLAMLHEKELVLNKEDTSNFLSGISMIRDMTSLNGSIEKSILQSIANMAVQVSGINPSSINTNNSTQSNNNTFNITAEFPNANSVDDIREAILTLPNIASQFINSNLK